MTSVRNIIISAIHTGENAIISSSMSYFLGRNYCDAALYLVPGQLTVNLRLEKKHRTRGGGGGGLEYKKGRGARRLA